MLRLLSIAALHTSHSQQRPLQMLFIKKGPKHCVAGTIWPALVLSTYLLMLRFSSSGCDESYDCGQGCWSAKQTRTWHAR